MISIRVQCSMHEYIIDCYIYFCLKYILKLQFEQEFILLNLLYYDNI